MEKVWFKWISRAKFDALETKNTNTIYFIYQEHVLYKGDQQYGGIQNISYTRDADNNYVITITNGDGTTTQLQVASSGNLIRLENAISTLQNNLTQHINTKADEDTSAHVKLTDNPIFTTDENGGISSTQDVNSNIAVTPKGVASMVDGLRSFVKFASYLNFPVVGSDKILYLAEDTGYLWVYKNGAYDIISDNWRRIKEIHGIIN